MAPLAPPLKDFDFPALAAILREIGADGWLLYDFHGVNPVATRVLGIQGMGTRRFFVLLPVAGAPVAVAHRIELASFAGFPGEVRPYAAWRELHAQLAPVVAGKTLAMEVSPGDGVPYMDRVPHGVVELLEGFGARVVPSAPLVTRFAARWSPEELTGHRRAAEAIAEIAQEALRWAGSETARGAEVRETAVQQRVLDGFARAGLFTDHPPIVGFQANAANPHYEPQVGADRRLAPGEVMLLDLWAGPARGTVFADQTWMGFAGRSPDAEVRRVWETVRAARDAAVARLRERWGKQPVAGAELDDAARGVIQRAGYGDHFVHRTGHSIDRDLHGSGPHLDNFETVDDRTLLAGVGFSVEPGIYLPGRFGVRSEVNVFLHETGPEVTPREPQQDLLLI
jgi:Xaa-Pro dipeptidase